MSADIEAQSWHVITKTENGTVSILRNLTLSEATKTYHALDPWRGRSSDGMRLVQGSDVLMREVIGPDGWDGALAPTAAEDAA